jgi:hypothetical protein
VTHVGVQCDFCGMSPICGVRYKSSVAGGEVLINRSTYRAEPFYLSSGTVLPIK